MLFKVAVKVWSTAVFKDSAETVVIYFYSVKLSNYSSIDEIFVYFVFSESVFDIAFLYTFVPSVVEVVYLAGNFPTVLQIKSLVDFRIASFSKKT